MSPEFVAESWDVLTHILQDCLLALGQSYSCSIVNQETLMIWENWPSPNHNKVQATCTWQGWRVLCNLTDGSTIWIWSSNKELETKSEANHGNKFVGLTNCGLVTDMVTYFWVNIGSGSSWLSDGTKPLPQAVLTYYQWVVPFSRTHLQPVSQNLYE